MKIKLIFDSHRYKIIDSDEPKYIGKYVNLIKLNPIYFSHYFDFDITTGLLYDSHVGDFVAIANIKE